MDTAAVADKIRQARAKLDEIVQRVCGSCERNCCHQGTMMGSQDLRRLVRGLRLDPDLAPRLREGLRERAEEIQADVDAARRVLELTRSAGLAQPADLAAAEKAVARLAELAEMMRSDFPLDYENLSRLLLHTAMRHNVIRAFRALPGGEAALTRFATNKSSFHYRGRRLAPPRCIFHSLTLGCLAGRWKPAKCANFFCPADPGILDAVREEMDFDTFVLANMEVVTPTRLEEVLAAMIDLGPEYYEPLVVLGIRPDGAAALAAKITALGPRAAVEEHSGPPPAAADVELWGENVAADAAVVHVLPRLAPRDLYDIAIGFDHLRLNDMNRLMVLAAGEFTVPSAEPHPLWSSRMMAQPIGYWEFYLLDAGA